MNVIFFLIKNKNGFRLFILGTNQYLNYTTNNCYLIKKNKNKNKNLNFFFSTLYCLRIYIRLILLISFYIQVIWFIG